ncbi:hypothetical protein HYV83_05305 [Candidatus Woesearchaeota archaeon]|nr:hypothetical protein [Candidatus Woesearchaeota archaeon]
MKTTANLKRIAIIVSSRDVAGMLIKQQLLKNYGFGEIKGEGFEGSAVYSLPVEDYEARLFTTASDSIHCENIDKRISAGLFVFATRHYSKAGVPSLTTHSVGNWGKADYGGQDGMICPTSASLLKLFLQNLAAVAKSGSYEGDVVQEATHHGPYIEKPAVFIEVGSTEPKSAAADWAQSPQRLGKEWNDERLAAMVADSLIGGLGDYVALENNFVPVVGLGGLHYASGFRKLMLDSDSKYAVGHICPRSHLANLTPELLRQAMSACVPEAKSVVLDWKGLGPEKQRIAGLLENSNVDWLKA